MTGKKVFMLGAVLLAILLIHSTAPAGELDEIRTAIRGKGAGWIAGETSLSRLASAEKQKRVGLLNPRSAPPGKVLALAAPSVSLPPGNDYRIKVQLFRPGGIGNKYWYVEAEDLSDGPFTIAP